MISPRECNVAKTSIDAYREGYEKGKSNNLVGHTAEAVFGLLRDDPGGHFMDGYRDGPLERLFVRPSTRMIGRTQAAGRACAFGERFTIVDDRL